MMHTDLILASASPRRKTLLEQIGYTFRVIPSHVEEPAYSGHHPAEYAMALASLKAGEISSQYPESLVVGADTIVVVGDIVLGKPADASEAHKMLSMLSNKSHEVITAYSFQHQSLGIDNVQFVSTEVHFRLLRDEEIDAYIATGSPFDKAGSYGIQDYSSIFVDGISGCFYNVVGLPLSDFDSKLQHLLRDNSLLLK